MPDSTYQPGRAAGLTGITSPNQGLGATYTVSLPLFEGPLDLLLYLIEQEKLDISEISLVAVTDQYLKSIEHLEEIAPGALADFLVVASRLLYIKSTRLLPKLQMVEGEEEDSTDNLVRHLLEYRQFKRAATELRSREDDGNRLFIRPPTMVDLGELSQKQPEFGELDAALLQNALKRALARISIETPLPQVQPYTVTVSERIESVRSLLTDTRSVEHPTRQLSFSGLLEEGSSRIVIIVTFLAVLELVKQRELVARQDATFGEILLFVVSEEEGGGKEGGDGDRDGFDAKDLAAATEPEE